MQRPHLIYNSTTSFRYISELSICSRQTQKQASLIVNMSLSVRDGVVEAQICSAFLFALRDWGHFTMGSSTTDRKWVHMKNTRLRVSNDRDLGQAHLFPSPLIGPFSGPIPRGPARLSIRAVPWFPSCPTGATPLPFPRMLQPMLQSLWGLKRRILLWRRRWD